MHHHHSVREYRKRPDCTMAMKSSVNPIAFPFGSKGNKNTLNLII